MRKLILAGLAGGLHRPIGARAKPGIEPLHSNPIRWPVIGVRPVGEGRASGDRFRL